MSTRFNIYHNSELVGQDYLNEDGIFRHKWFCKKSNEFERGSWRGRAHGDNELNWIYKEIIEE